MWSKAPFQARARPCAQARCTCRSTTAYTLNELDYFIGDAEPSLVVCDPSKAEGFGAIAAKVSAKVETLGADGKGSLTDAAANAPSEFNTVARADDDLAAILYTSGTTGRFQGRDADA